MQQKVYRSEDLRAYLHAVHLYLRDTHGDARDARQLHDTHGPTMIGQLPPIGLREHIAPCPTVYAQLIDIIAYLHRHTRHMLYHGGGHLVQLLWAVVRREVSVCIGCANEGERGVGIVVEHIVALQRLGPYHAQRFKSILTRHLRHVYAEVLLALLGDAPEVEHMGRIGATLHARHATHIGDAAVAIATRHGMEVLTIDHGARRTRVEDKPPMQRVELSLHGYHLIGQQAERHTNDLWRLGRGHSFCPALLCLPVAVGTLRQHERQQAATHYVAYLSQHAHTSSFQRAKVRKN